MRALIVSSLFVAALSAGIAQAETLRCGGRLVSVGDTAVELKVRCGAPDHVEVREVVRTVGVSAPSVGVLDARPGAGRQVFASQVPLRQQVTQREAIEVWTYRGDGRSFARAVTVRRGKVARVSTLGPLELPSDPGCAKTMFDVGTRVGVVRLACGAPVDQARWEEATETEINGTLVGGVTVRERWTYAPGPGRLLRILEFANGRLVSIETGGRVD